MDRMEELKEALEDHMMEYLNDQVGDIGFMDMFMEENEVTEEEWEKLKKYNFVVEAV